MNINLMPTSESSKLAKSSSEQEVTTHDSHGHEGFFAKLMSLVSGEPSSETKVAESSGHSGEVVTEEASAEAEGVDVDVAEGEISADALKTNREEAPVLEGEDSELALLEQGKAAAPDQERQSSDDVDKIISESDELLARLGEANQALQTQSGKSLPPEQLEDTELADQELATQQAMQQARTTDLSTEPSSQEDVAQVTQTADSANSDLQNTAQALPDAQQADSITSAEDDELISQHIVWGASDEAKMSKDLSVSKDIPAKAATQTQVANSVAQALNSAPQATVNDKTVVPSAAAAPGSAELNAAQLLVGQNAKGGEKTDVEGLKAALNASIGASVSKNAQAEKLASTLGQGQDESFAQQLAHATGHQGQSQSINPLARNEQVQAQAPLVLQRDMAGEQLAERVQVMLSKNLKNIDIRLDPPELGRLHIRMNMNGDGASVQFTVANPQARDMIEQSMPRLREMLAQQGVQLSDTSVQQQSSGQQQSHYAQGGDGQDAQNSGSAASLSDENIDANVKVDVNVATKRDGISYYA